MSEENKEVQEKRKVEAVFSEKLSKNNGKRYVIIDNETGEVLDDAQGWGYKSVRNAYAAYSFKTRDKTKDGEKAQLKEKIKKWMKEHKAFVRLMEQFAFEIAKGSWGHDDKFDAKFVRQMLKDNNLEVDFKPSELLKVWRNSK